MGSAPRPAGIVLAILGFGFCLFVWAIASIMINDSILRAISRATSAQDLEQLLTAPGPLPQMR
jgi:hypothetical protein